MAFGSRLVKCMDIYSHFWKRRSNRKIWLFISWLYRLHISTIVDGGISSVKKLCQKKNEKKRNMQEIMTGMEYAVAFLAGLGWSNQEIGDYFDVSVRTVKYYMTAVFYKLNINSRQEIPELLD